MHENCNIMRDLMPLCIDGAASDDSHRAVSRHIADCDECLKYYRELQTDMTRALESRPTEDEVKQAMRLVARKRRRRILLIVLAAAAGLFLLWALLYWLTNSPIYVDNSDYAVELYTTDQGYIFMEYRSLNGRWQTHYMRFDEQTRTVHIIGETVRLPLSPANDTQMATTSMLFWYDDETGFMWREGRNAYAVAEIRRGRSDQPEEILWKNGDPRPPARSEELQGMTAFATVPPMAMVTPMPEEYAPFATLPPRVTVTPMPAEPTPVP